MKSGKQKAESRRQGGESRKVDCSRSLPTGYCLLPSAVRGFSLIELIITISVLTILTLGVIPLVQVSVKRQKELQLRAALREMREAIDQFHREALAGAQMQVNQQGQGTAQQEQAPRNPQTQNPNQQRGPNIFDDPRVRVAITDQTIFTADNPDRFPPDLDTLVKGVDVLPITAGNLGRRGNLNYTATEAASGDSAIPKTKIYLRQIPIDPMTGQKDWVFRSCYDAVDATTWGGENIFDVHSKSAGTALNGDKYSDW
ncbi:MAG TPA: type II secretion system protein [Pyrinomonadaceae bacterium]|nr:type II secretion system protein [Pyrinomonadaceae bacterium]